MMVTLVRHDGRHHGPFLGLIDPYHYPYHHPYCTPCRKKEPRICFNLVENFTETKLK